VCCKCLFSMFHLFFFDVRCKYVYLDVVYVSNICCKCFIWMLHMSIMVFHVFLHEFQAHVSNVSVVLYVCCKIVSFRYFTSRSNVLCMLQCEPLVTAARASCMEGSGAAMEVRGKQGNMGE
jgi:hypothetical protein